MCVRKKKQSWLSKVFKKSWNFLSQSDFKMSQCKEQYKYRWLYFFEKICTKNPMSQNKFLDFWYSFLFIESKWRCVTFGNELGYFQMPMFVSPDIVNGSDPLLVTFSGKTHTNPFSLGRKQNQWGKYYLILEGSREMLNTKKSMYWFNENRRVPTKVYGNMLGRLKFNFSPRSQIGDGEKRGGDFFKIKN